jgi:hypothetical protein
MELFPRSIDAGLHGRLDGPGKLRFILQPLLSTSLGIRDGIADAKAGRPPYFVGLLFKHKTTPEDRKKAFRQLAGPLTFGTVLDLIFQWIIFHQHLLIPAILVGTVLAALPYSIARAISNRIARRIIARRTARAASGAALGS